MHLVLCLHLILSDQFNLTRSPGLIDPGLERAVHAQDGEPALAGDRLHPVILESFRRLGSEIDGVGSIPVLLDIFVVTANGRELLVALSSTFTQSTPPHPCNLTTQRSILCELEQVRTSAPKSLFLLVSVTLACLVYQRNQIPVCIFIIKAHKMLLAHRSRLLEHNHFQPFIIFFIKFACSK